MTQWDNTLHLESEGFWLESHWCARSYCGNQRYHETPGGLRVVLVRLPPCQWPKVGLSAAKWAIKNVWANFTFCFVFFIAALDKQANIHCSINSISRPISSHDYNSTDQAIAMGRSQSDFRKLDKFFSGKQQAAVKTDHKIYTLLIYEFIYDFFLSKDFQSSYITFVIFNNSIFFGTTENKWKVTINFENT